MNKIMFNKLIKSTLFITGAFLVFWLIPEAVFAQMDGLQTVGDATGLQATDPRIIAGRLIRAFLSILGVIATVMVVYAGFLWMTAAGDEGKVEKAKKILINGVIGLIIIFSSIGIVSLVMGSILRSTGADISGGSGVAGPGGGSFGGSGTTQLVVAGFRPQGEVPVRNVVAQVIFSRAVNVDSVDGAIQVFNNETAEEIPVEIDFGNDRTVRIRPQTECPAPNDDRNCFDENIEVRVSILDTIRSSVGQSLACSVIHPCSFVFSVGDIIDTTPPAVNFQTPSLNQRVSPLDILSVQVRVSDDSQVSHADFSANEILFDSVPASGENLSDVFINTEWDPSSFEQGEKHTLTAVASDIAGNTASRSVNIRLNPAHCYNGLMDENLGETGVDCGGVCGACIGGSCSEDSDCSRGACSEGVCVAQPKIISVNPPGGAPGTYTLIEGELFGGPGGTVYFTGEDGSEIVADVPAQCHGWNDTSVLVEVPVGAIDGPIRLETAFGLSDSTDDDYGDHLPNVFDVNDVRRPQLCSLSPNTGRQGSTITLTGSGFGSERENSFVNFALNSVTNADISNYQSWGSSQIRVGVPNIEQGDYNVTVTVDGQTSNPLPYFIRGIDEEGADSLPVIESISPDSDGARGDTITITGRGFGDIMGQVLFRNEAGLEAQGSTIFPAQCDNASLWRGDQIVVRVPESYTNGDDVDFSVHDLVVVRNNGRRSQAVDFEVVNRAPSPGICALSPNRELAGAEIEIFGSNLGNEGEVVFTGAEQDNSLTWGNTRISLLVPEGGQTGPVFVRTGGNDSNSLNFAYGAPETEVVFEATGGGYGWTFSTGEVPIVPELLIACTQDPRVLSAVPNARFNEVSCLNVKIIGQFNVEMNEGILTDAIRVRECSNAGCSIFEDEDFEVDISFTSNQNEFTRFEITRVEDGVVVNWPAETRIYVSIDESARSVHGIEMVDDIGWQFLTGDENDICEIEAVGVNPATRTFVQKGESGAFTALPIARQCLVLNDEFNWNWSVDTNGVLTLQDSCENDDDACIADALLDGRTNLEAREAESGLIGVSDVLVRFVEPYIQSFRPDCGEACLNAGIGGRFNIPVQISGINGITGVDNVILEKCDNELCSSPNRMENASVICVEEKPDILGVDGCVDFAVNIGINLELNTYYQVRVSGNVASTSGKSLGRLNEGGQFVWRFRSGENVCAIENILVSPSTVTARSVNHRQTFNAIPLGPPDSCSEAGQRLNAFDYDWSWIDPIVDEEQVAEWVKIEGDLFTLRNASIVNGCTDRCLPVGSQPYIAICGNGILEKGEECDPINAMDGDGCSSSCLREPWSKMNNATEIETEDDGADPLWKFVVGNDSYEVSCGDGVLDRFELVLNQDSVIVPGPRIPDDVTQKLANDKDTFAYGWIGEECDPGPDGDWSGCDRNTCMNLGARSSGLTCGNNDVAWVPSRGGLDCDDGNRVSGDGCSAQCLNEGSISINKAPAVCGDGIITSPWETCDPGIEGQEWCPENCIRPGIIASMPNACGNGIVEAWEDCDPADPITKDGCTDTCQWKGSSLSNPIPSICGDGIVAPGEYDKCEVAVGDSATLRVAPNQVAKISDTAPRVVSELGDENNIVSATISVKTEEADGVIGTASYNLSCSARNDLDCSDAETEGVGIGNCCSTRPNILAIRPPDESDNVCLNVLPTIIFDTKMDTSSIGDNVKLIYEGDGCPAGHIRETAGIRADGAFAWLRIFTNWFIPSLSAQDEGGECVVPVRRVEQNKITINDDDAWEINVFTGVALASSANYKFEIIGDEVNLQSGESAGVGVRSDLGVRMLNSRSSSFTAGETICEVDQVSVRDPEGEPEGFFSRSGETRRFVARANSVRGGRVQMIQPIEGVYSWSWLPWRETSNESIVIISEDEDEEADVQAATESGKSFAVAGVEIDSNEETQRRVIGGLEITTFFCENPWPSLDNYPFEDTAERGDESGASEGRAWTNFAMYYCRDQQGQANDLPGLRVVLPDEQPVGTQIFKEYLFEVEDGSGDAIGLRVASNPNYLTPIEWYRDQGFTGNPSQIVVNGLPALRDGRTVYVVAPNQDEGNRIYSNVYIISHNQLASNSTQNIFNQLLENFELLANISNEAFCTTGEIGAECETHTDCGAGGICGNNRDQLLRDSRRINDIVSLSRSIDDYALENGRCSLTGSQSCNNDGMCPVGESCVPTAPRLEAGTFVPGMTASTWPSWTNELASLVGNAPIDPINRYGGECPLGEDGQPNMTCYDAGERIYECNEGSYVYHYKIEPQGSYVVSAEMEYGLGIWAQNLPETRVGRIHLTVPSERLQTLTGGSVPTKVGFETDLLMCGIGQIFGESAMCGDGIVGGDEICEPGVSRRTELCTLADGRNGWREMRCANDCSGFESDEDAQCIPFTCGNGVIDPGEICDDGVDNGRYGFCGIDCTYNAGSAAFCGDGFLSAGEFCDLGDDNGVYAQSAVDSCAWDCRGPGPHCGDGIVQAVHNEQCDGGVQTWAGPLCPNGDICNAVGEACDGGGVCGDAKLACTPARVCLAGSATKINNVCSTDADCDSSVNGQSQGDGLCSPDSLPRHRVRGCGEPGGENQCQWLNWSGCVPVSTCGNGIVEPGEECDDGNRNNNDSCTNACKFNVCGDGIIHEGIEQCDNGPLNGIPCNPAYGETCTYCSSQCRLVVNTGGFCGDGEWNQATEFCEGEDVRYAYVTPAGVVEGYCLPDKLGEADGDAVCLRAGVCSGGNRDGEVMVSAPAGIMPDSHADLVGCGGGGEEIWPKCNQTCTAACPFTYQYANVQFRSDFEGASLSSSIDLVRSSDEIDQVTSNLSRSGTIVFPACRVAGGLIGDVETSISRPSKALVTFVLDFSGSMYWSLGGTRRINVLIDSLKEGVEELFNKMGENVSIRIVVYGPSLTDTGFNTLSRDFSTLGNISDFNTMYDNYIFRYQDNNDVSNQNRSSSLFNFSFYSNELFRITNEQSLLSLIDGLQVAFDAYMSDGGNAGTPSNIGFATGSYMLEKDYNTLSSSIKNDTSKILVFMTDGEFSYRSSTDRSRNPYLAACRAHQLNQNVFTLGLLNGNQTLQSDLERGVYDPYRSSGNPALDTLLRLTAENSTGRRDSTICEVLFTEQAGYIANNGPDGNGGIRRFGLIIGENSAGANQCFALGLARGVPSDNGTVNHLACMSSGNPDLESGIDYAHIGRNKAEFESAFRQIISSISGITINFGQGNSVSVNPGRGVEIPLPDNFVCSPQSAQYPITVAYEGREGGSVRLSNLRFAHCSQ